MIKVRVLAGCVALGGIAMLGGCVAYPAGYAAAPYGSYSGYSSYSSPYYVEPGPVVVPAPSVYISGSYYGGYYSRPYSRPYYGHGYPYYGRAPYYGAGAHAWAHPNGGRPPGWRGGGGPRTQPDRP